MKYVKNREKVVVDKINESRIKDKNFLINTSENYYKNRISEVVNLALSEKRNITLLTGPSSSGKTTSAILLTNEFERRGKKAMRVSLDNFYKNRDELPLWEDGTKNFETIDGLDLNLFSNVVNEMISTGTAKFPIFDFSKGIKSKHTFSVNYDEDTYVIFEGIHALIPVFIDVLKANDVLRLYVSVHTDFVDINNNIVLNAQDLRLIRRMLRDNSDRATPPEMTMDFWDKVCRGEAEYIVPYKALADAHINSTHYYEPLVYKKPLKKLLSSVNSSEYKEKFDQLIAALEHFQSIPVSDVPKTSMLREFINETHYSSKPVEHPREMS